MTYTTQDRTSGDLYTTQPYKSLNNLAPYYLCDIFSSVSEYHTVSTRDATSNTLQQPRCDNSLYKSSLSVNESRLWNKLP